MQLILTLYSNPLLILQKLPHQNNVKSMAQQLLKLASEFSDHGCEDARIFIKKIFHINLTTVYLFSIFAAVSIKI